MAIEITLTFGKEGLKISQKLNPDIAISGDPTLLEAVRLKKTWAANQASRAADSKTSGGHSSGGGQSSGSAGPVDPGNQGGSPGGATILPSTSGTISIIGPIVITTCSCLKSHEEEEHKPEDKDKNV